MVMAEAISTVGFLLDVLVLMFVLYLHRRKDNRTWVQKMGASMMCWFLICHAFMHLMQFLPEWNLPLIDVLLYESWGGADWVMTEKDVMGTIFEEGLWKIAILGFFATALIMPMPVVKNANHFKIGVGVLLVLFLWETYYTWGAPTASPNYVMFWPLWSTVPSLMVLYMTYLAWNFLSSPEGAETRLEGFTDRAGLFSVMGVILWCGKNWFDFMGIFTEGGMFYWDGGYKNGDLHAVADLVTRFELGMMVFPLLVLSVGSIIYLKNRGSALLGGIILTFLVLGAINYRIYGGGTPDYGLVAIFVDEASFGASFSLLTHGTMQSLARPLIVLFLVIRFGMVRVDHAPQMSRAMTIMALAGAMSVITEILQPMLGVPQLLSGFFLGALLAFEIERKIMAAMQPKEGEENPDWTLKDGDGDDLHRFVNIAIGTYLVLTLALGYLIGYGVMFV